ncbi:MAG: hypothetical protein EBU37_04405, partial [Actinobacteria bacterium]|nr:hypothetical protein [Actinomycetota bacterium]
MQVVVTKHHGLGNDFLVLDLGQLQSQKVEPSKVRLVCAIALFVEVPFAINTLLVAGFDMA